jgi:hypothetical protein
MPRIPCSPRRAADRAAPCRGRAAQAMIELFAGLTDALNEI